MANQIKPIVQRNPIRRVRYGSQPSLTIPETQPAAPVADAVKLKIDVKKPATQPQKLRRKETQILNPKTGKVRKGILI
jgi:hypothetical protein